MQRCATVTAPNDGRGLQVKPLVPAQRIRLSKFNTARVAPVWCSQGPKLHSGQGLSNMVRTKRLCEFASVVALAAFGLGNSARADGAADASGGSWWDTVKFSGFVDAGGLGQPSRDHDSNNLNFGHLFTDKASRVQLNQLTLTLERPIDSKKSNDVGFKFQGMYGSDARYTHFLGELDRVTNNKEQLDIIESWLLFHTPWLGESGTDIKVGQYVTLEGAEVIDPRGNFFYSHSYIFNFGIPFKHTGVLATTHVNSVLDVYYGIDTGVNTTFGPGRGDTNNDLAFHGGFGLNLMNGDLTILATTHIGPELPERNALAVSHADTRYLNDVTAIWKISKSLTSTTDFNYIRDDTKVFGPNGNSSAEGYGVAQYFTYSVNDNLSLGLRGEVWRDAQGAFVGACPGNTDFVNAELGRPNGCFGSTGAGNAPKATTYYAVTLGANFKLPVDKRFEGTVIRPELRWDHASGATPFDGGTDHDQVTIGADVVVPLSIWH